MRIEDVRDVMIAVERKEFVNPITIVRAIRHCLLVIECMADCIENNYACYSYAPSRVINEYFKSAEEALEKHNE